MIASWYRACSLQMETGPWYEQRRAYATREANLSDFIQTFQAVDDSDRFRSTLLTRYGTDLCVSVLNRLIADLVKEADGATTIGSAEKMTLGEVVARLATPQGKPAMQTPTTVPANGQRVVLCGLGEGPFVCGVEKHLLTLAQYDVVNALLEAGERGLSKDELGRRSKHGDARNILKRLAKSDPDWQAVICFPGKTGGGYRIK
jgi:hypothetical protein